MERNPTEVLLEIRKVIPESEHLIHHELNEAFKRAKYKAPELARHTWNDLARILNDTMMGDRFLQPSDPDWKHKAIQIFMGEESEREEQVLLHGNTN